MKYLIITNIVLLFCYSLEVLENTKLKKLLKEFIEEDVK